MLAVLRSSRTCDGFPCPLMCDRRRPGCVFMSNLGLNASHKEPETQSSSCDTGCDRASANLISSVIEDLYHCCRSSRNDTADSGSDTLIDGGHCSRDTTAWIYGRGKGGSLIIGSRHNDDGAASLRRGCYRVRSDCGILLLRGRSGRERGCLIWL